MKTDITILSRKEKLETVLGWKIREKPCELFWTYLVPSCRHCDIDTNLPWTSILKKKDSFKFIHHFKILEYWTTFLLSKDYSEKDGFININKQNKTSKWPEAKLVWAYNPNTHTNKNNTKKKKKIKKKRKGKENRKEKKKKKFN